MTQQDWLKLTGPYLGSLLLTYCEIGALASNWPARRRTVTVAIPDNAKQPMEPQAYALYKSQVESAA